MNILLRRCGGGLVLACLGLGLPTAANAVGNVVISQVYGGGGNSGALWKNDYIELFNRGVTAVSLAGWSVQYASATGSSWQKTDLPAFTLAPGQYFLVQQAVGAGGSQNLPAPDATGTIAMSATSGKLALLNVATLLSATSCPAGATVVDFVGFGTANCAEGTAVGALSNSSAAVRKDNGATDSDNNSADFQIVTANGFTPRNSAVSARPVVSVVAADYSAGEAGPDVGQFVLTRSGGDTAQGLTVDFALGGSAESGVDYAALPGSSVSFAANQTSATLTVTPVDDALAEGTETVSLTLVVGDSYSVEGSPAVITVTDDDAPDTAPTVVGITPADGASAVPPGSTVTVNFSEQVNLAAGAVTLSCPLGTPVASNAAATNLNSLRLTPTSPLPAGVSCSLMVLASGVSDVDTRDPPAQLAGDFTSSFSTGATTTCSAVDTPIGQIQGSGATAALSGTQTVQGVVVADYEGADPALRGFYLQNPAVGADGNAATSDGIFVFNGNSDSVSVGQTVQVTGTISEYGFGSAGGTQTQISAQAIETCGVGSVSPVDLSLPLASADDLERYEGMLVRFPQALTVSEHYQLGRFGQVLLGGTGRLPQPTHVSAPGAAASAVAAANARNQIVLDDATQTQNPDPVVFARGGAALNASNTLRGGDTVTGLRGVLTQTDATTASFVPATSDPVRYRVRPQNTLNAEFPVFVAANARAPLALQGPADGLRVVTFNVLNYFNTFGTGACTNGVSGTAADCRGAENSAEFERQAAKTVQAILGTGADVVALNEIENDGYGASSAIQNLVTRLDAASGAGTWRFINPDLATGQLNALGTDAIKVGLLYKPARVTPVGSTAVANTGAFGLYSTGSGSIGRNRPALAQAFSESSAAGGRFVVVANHLKSKGSDCADNVSPVGPDPDLGDGQGNCNLTRTAAATQLGSWLAGDPTASGSSNVLILGDLNAYAKEDPIAALLAAGYVNLNYQFNGDADYSYVFDGQWGYLDHALATSSLVSQIVDVKHWHINADEPVVLDYNQNFKSSAQQSAYYAADAYRSSDHDPVVLALALDSDGDGLGDRLELALGSAALDLDSDDDGLADGTEDANRNGVVDPGETSPVNADTDGDGLSDGVERGISSGVADPDGAGPLSATDSARFVPDADNRTVTNPTAADSDGDGVPDGQEDLNRNGRLDSGESDPASAASLPVLTRKVPAFGLVPGVALLVGLWLVGCRRRALR